VLCEGHPEGDVAALHFQPSLVELRRADGSVIERRAYDPGEGMVRFESDERAEALTPFGAGYFQSNPPRRPAAEVHVT
jgi:hypothetical protein